jgi:hypothetical protein
MTLAAQLLVALLVLTISSFAPGFFIIRRLRWSPLEKLNGSVALSLTLVYCASFFLYAIHAERRWQWLISSACLLLAIVTFRDARRLFAAPQVRRAVAAFAFLLVWCLAFLALIRHFAGGGWSYDYVEHFHRTIFFLDSLPLDTHFGDYHLAARPPFMNVIAAYVLAQAGEGFELFSVAFTFLNVLAVLPCLLLLRTIATRGAKRTWILVALFACNPLFVENATYTWTKLLSAFFVLFALWLYLAGWRKDDPSRTIAAFIALAAGVLVHYSAAPYLIAISLHYGVRLLTGRRWKEAAIGAALSIALLATWLGWSVATYGTTTTLETNTTVTGSAEWNAAGHSSTAKVALNVFNTFVPHPFRKIVDRFDQESFAGYVRDYTFVIYQPNLIFAMGVVAGPLVVVLLVQLLRRRARERSFWLLYLAVSVVLGIAVHGAPDDYGVAHVTLQPLILLGLTFLAARLPHLPRAVKWLVVFGCLADAALGIFLHMALQHEERDTGAFRIAIVRKADGTLADSPESKFSRFALGNWWAKQERVLIADTLGRPEVARDPTLSRNLSWELVLLRDDDRRLWKGWYARNAEHFTFLGDRLKPAAVPIAVLIAAMFAAVMTVLVRTAVRRET